MVDSNGLATALPGATGRREPASGRMERGIVDPPSSGHVLASDADFAPYHEKYLQVKTLLYRDVPAGRLPGRKNFDPVEVPRLLVYINLVEVVRTEGGLRFRYKLYGSRQRWVADKDLTGLFVEEAVSPDFVDRINTNMRTAVERRLPVYDRFENPIEDRRFIETERVYFPLADDGETVDTILILNGYIE